MNLSDYYSTVYICKWDNESNILGEQYISILTNCVYTEIQCCTVYVSGIKRDHNKKGNNN